MLKPIPKLLTKNSVIAILDNHRAMAMQRNERPEEVENISSIINEIEEKGVDQFLRTIGVIPSATSSSRSKARQPARKRPRPA